MDKQNDLHESDRNLLGGLVGAVAVAICVGPLLLVVSGRPSLVSIGLLLFMGCVAGSVGANTGEPLRAVVLGVLPFTMVAGFYLPFTIFFLKVADWWGFDPSRDTLTFDILAFMLSAAALGGLCGIRGKRGRPGDAAIGHGKAAVAIHASRNALDLCPRRLVPRSDSVLPCRKAVAVSPPDDPQVLELLDSYLSQLQAGKRPDREALLREHPELSASLKCLEALEGIAPAAVDDSDLVDITLLENSRLPREFGPYQLLEEIGRGGMGVVYKARQKALDRVVALKMILATHLASPEHIRRFQTEAWAAARLRHSNITHIHDVGQHNGQHYFTLDYIEGESLAQRIARQRLSTEAIVPRAGQRGRPGGRAPARPGSGPSRPEAFEHPPGPRRPALRDRLRSGQSFCARLRGDDNGSDRRHAQLHGPRAGIGARLRGRSRHGRLQSRGDPLRVAHGRAALPLRESGRHAPGHPQPRAPLSASA